MEYVIIGIIGAVVVGFGVVMSYLDMSGKKKPKDSSGQSPEEEQKDTKNKR